MLSQRVGVFTESVIREMTRLAFQHGAINLAQGYPDFPAPEALKEAAVAAIRGDINQYAITWGAPRLREAIARKMRRFNGIDADPERDITVTCGATEAMMATLLATVNPGDEVIVFEPFYENYVPDAAMCGAKLVYVPLVEPDFTFDPDQLKAAFSTRTKAIIVNTPNNPSGRIFSRTELEYIAELCQRYNAIAITDEVYEHIVFDGHQHISIASLPGMAGRTVTISGFSKTFSVTGWRLGYVVAKPPLSDGVRKVHDFLTVGAAAPLQEAAAAALEFGDEYYDELRTEYNRRRELLLTSLQKVGFRCFRPQGAYYIMADFSPLSKLSDFEFARYLIEHVGVAAVPGSSFYADKELGSSKIRFTFSKSDATIIEATRRLTALAGA